MLGTTSTIERTWLPYKSMFRIQRSANGKVVVLTLSGRIKEADLTELQKLLECEAGDHSLTWDLKEVRLMDRDVIGFVAVAKRKASTLRTARHISRSGLKLKVMKRRINAITQLLDKILRFLLHGLERSGGEISPADEESANFFSQIAFQPNRKRKTLLISRTPDDHRTSSIWHDRALNAFCNTNNSKSNKGVV